MHTFYRFTKQDTQINTTMAYDYKINDEQYFISENN